MKRNETGEKMAAKADGFTPGKEAAAIRTIQNDPEYFCRTFLGLKPWPIQAAVMRSVRDNRTTAVRSCHGIGKSLTGAAICHWFLYSFPRSIIVTTAPTNRQVRSILWGEIRLLHSRGLKRGLWGECNTQDLRLMEKWEAIGFTATEYSPDKFQGFHADHILVVVDEAAGVSDEIFLGVDALMSAGHARKLMLGNPTGTSGEFWRSFRDPHVSKFAVDAFSTPNFTNAGITVEDIRSGEWREKQKKHGLSHPFLITPEWVAERHRQWGENSPHWQSRILAAFPEVGDGGLIPLSWIEAAHHSEHKTQGQVVFGVDVGGGSAESVIVERTGKAARVLDVSRFKDTMQTCGWIAKWIRERNPAKVYVDEIGIGAGVKDRLIESGFTCVEGVNVGEQPSGYDADRFTNKKAQYYWNIREQFERREIALPDESDEVLESQLAQIEYSIDSRGRIKIKSKEEMAREGKPSPDRAEAFMLAFGVPVYQTTRHDFGVENRSVFSGGASDGNPWT